MNRNKRARLIRAIGRSQALVSTQKINLTNAAFSLSTLITAIAALVISINQTQIQSRALAMEQKRIEPNIIAKSDYFPLLSPDQILSNPTLLTDHKVTLFGNLDFVNDVKVEHNVIFDYTAQSRYSNDRIRQQIALNYYFWFCNVSVELVSERFATCIADRNLENARKIEDTIRNYVDDEYAILNVSKKILFEISYTTLLGDKVKAYLELNPNGQSNGDHIEELYDEVRTNSWKNYLTISSDEETVAETLKENLALSFSQDTN